jgi:exonuclease SbcD
MKILHFADVHLGMENYGKIDPASGLTSRFADFLCSLDKIVAFAKDPKNKIDLVIFAGDAYKTRDPSPTYMKAFAERVKKIADSIPVVLLVGNHDLPQGVGKANTLDIFSTLDVPNVYVGRKPSLMNIKTKDGDVQVGTLPWMSKSQLLDENARQKSIKDTNTYLTEKLGSFLKEINEKIDPEKPSILAAHFSIIGAQYSSEQSVMLGGDLAVSLKDLRNTHFNYVALGHLHKFQVLSQKPLTIFPGSIERIDFGEEKEKKGFVVAEIKKISKRKFNTSYAFIELAVRRFLRIKITIPQNNQNPTKYVLAELKKYDVSNAVVKIEISLLSEQEEILEESKIKDQINKAFLLAGFSKEIIDTFEKKSIDFIEEKIGPKELLDKYLEQKKYSKKKREEIIQYAEDLMSEVEL